MIGIEIYVYYSVFVLLLQLLRKLISYFKARHMSPKIQISVLCSLWFDTRKLYNHLLHRDDFIILMQYLLQIVWQSLPLPGHP